MSKGMNTENLHLLTYQTRNFVHKSIDAGIEIVVLNIERLVETERRITLLQTGGRQDQSSELWTINMMENNDVPSAEILRKVGANQDLSTKTHIL